MRSSWGHPGTFTYFDQALMSRTYEVIVVSGDDHFYLGSFAFSTLKYLIDDGKYKYLEIHN